MVKKFDMRVCVAALVMTLACGSVAAQPHCVHNRGHRVVAVVGRPAVTVAISNHLTRKERLSMVLAWLGNHKYVSIRQYAKMTGLKKTTAEAELDAFSYGAASPLRVVVKGKKKLYVKR